MDTSVEKKKRYEKNTARQISTPNLQPTNRLWRVSNLVTQGKISVKPRFKPLALNLRAHSVGNVKSNVKTPVWALPLISHRAKIPLVLVTLAKW
jgi:hypothetical protein